MSDDLISRKAIYKAISDYLNRSRLGETSAQTDLRAGEIASIIHGVPTAFNKEKVKIQIKNKVGIGMCQEENCKKIQQRL